MSFIGAALAIGFGSAAAAGTAAIGGVAASTVLGAASLGAAALGTGLSASGALSSSPNYGDPAASSAAMADATASNLPKTLQLQAAAQEGGVVDMPLSTEQQKQLDGLNSQIASIQQQIQQAQAMPVSGDGRRNSGGGVDTRRLTDLQTQLASLQKQAGSITSGSKADFTGNSTADIQGRIQQQLAQGQLDTAKQYDSQFIAQQLAEEKQANPQGVAAREALYNDVQQAVNNPPPVSPVATTMDKQINDRVAAGSGLTPEEQATLDAAVNGSTMTGTSGNAPNLSGNLTTGFAGEQRALQNAGSGATWLASGQTPADVQYREQQQGLSDLSSYISGQTPQSQFGQLSGSQSGPTPNSGTNYLPSFDSSAAQMGAQGAVDQYGQQVQSQLSQANPWTSGLSMAISGTNALVKSGAFK